MKHFAGTPVPKSGKKKKQSISSLKKKLWTVFSLYIRTRDNYTCFTCGTKGEGMNMHAGHFISKAAGGLALYFNEINVNAQCLRCNIHLDGMQWEYGLRLGPEKVAQLYKLKQEVWKWSIFDYQQKIVEYQGKLDALQENL